MQTLGVALILCDLINNIEEMIRVESPTSLSDFQEVVADLRQELGQYDNPNKRKGREVFISDSDLNGFIDKFDFV